MNEACLLSNEEMESEVNRFLVRKYGVATALRYFASRHQPDGIDYTRDRHKWLPQDEEGFNRLMSARNPELDRIMAAVNRCSMERKRSAAKTAARGAKRQRALVRKCASAGAIA